MNDEVKEIVAVQEEVGIEETWDVLNAVIEIANGVDQANEDGKIGVGEILSVVVGASFSILEAVQDSNLIKRELKDYSDADHTELVSRVASKLDIRDDKAEEVVEDIFRLISSIYRFYVKHFAGNEAE